MAETPSLMLAEHVALGVQEGRLCQTTPYKNFSTDLEQAFIEFEKAEEWADLISALAKLIKVLENKKYASFSFIPRARLVPMMKILGQCTNKGLPSGVHLRALDVYNLLYSRLSPDFLIKDLPLYFNGILQLFPNAAESVRHKLAGLYETYLLPLGERLTVILPSVLVSILPGLEDPTSDIYTQTMQLLNSISSHVGFYPLLFHLWSIVKSIPSGRSTALAYLHHILPRPTDYETSGYLILSSPDGDDDDDTGTDAERSAPPGTSSIMLSAPTPGEQHSIDPSLFVRLPSREMPANLQVLIIEALHETLSDNNIIAQRLILDLFLAYFPLHYPTHLIIRKELLASLNPPTEEASSHTDHGDGLSLSTTPSELSVTASYGSRSLSNDGHVAHGLEGTGGGIDILPEEPLDSPFSPSETRAMDFTADTDHTHMEDDHDHHGQDPFTTSPTAHDALALTTGSHHVPHETTPHGDVDDDIDDPHGVHQSRLDRLQNKAGDTAFSDDVLAEIPAITCTFSPLGHIKIVTLLFTLLSAQDPSVSRRIEKYLLQSTTSKTDTTSQGATDSSDVSITVFTPYADYIIYQVLSSILLTGANLVQSLPGIELVSNSPLEHTHRQGKGAYSHQPATRSSGLIDPPSVIIQTALRLAAFDDSESTPPQHMIDYDITRFHQQLYPTELSSILASPSFDVQVPEPLMICSHIQQHYQQIAFPFLLLSHMLTMNDELCEVVLNSQLLQRIQDQLLLYTYGTYLLSTLTNLIHLKAKGVDIHAHQVNAGIRSFQSSTSSSPPASGNGGSSINRDASPHNYTLQQILGQQQPIDADSNTSAILAYTTGCVLYRPVMVSLNPSNKSHYLHAPPGNHPFSTSLGLGASSVSIPPPHIVARCLQAEIISIRLLRHVHSFYMTLLSKESNLRRPLLALDASSPHPLLSTPGSPPSSMDSVTVVWSNLLSRIVYHTKQLQNSGQSPEVASSTDSIDTDHVLHLYRLVKMLLFFQNFLPSPLKSRQVEVNTSSATADLNTLSETPDVPESGLDTIPILFNVIQTLLTKAFPSTSSFQNNIWALLTTIIDVLIKLLNFKPKVLRKNAQSVMNFCSARDGKNNHTSDDANRIGDKLGSQFPALAGMDTPHVFNANHVCQLAQAILKTLFIDIQSKQDGMKSYGGIPHSIRHSLLWLVHKLLLIHPPGSASLQHQPQYISSSHASVEDHLHHEHLHNHVITYLDSQSGNFNDVSQVSIPAMPNIILSLAIFYHLCISHGNNNIPLFFLGTHGMLLMTHYQQTLQPAVVDSIFSSSRSQSVITSYHMKDTSFQPLGSKKGDGESFAPRAYLPRLLSQVGIFLAHPTPPGASFSSTSPEKLREGLLELMKNVMDLVPTLFVSYICSLLSKSSQHSTTHVPDTILDVNNPLILDECRDMNLTQLFASLSLSITDLNTVVLLQSIWDLLEGHVSPGGHSQGCISPFHHTCTSTSTEHHPQQVLMNCGGNDIPCLCENTIETFTPSQSIDATRLVIAFQMMRTAFCESTVPIEHPVSSSPPPSASETGQYISDHIRRWIFTKASHDHTFLQYYTRLSLLVISPILTGVTPVLNWPTRGHPSSPVSSSDSLSNASSSLDESTTSELARVLSTPEISHFVESQLSLTQPPDLDELSGLEDDPHSEALPLEDNPVHADDANSITESGNMTVDNDLTLDEVASVIGSDGSEISDGIQMQLHFADDGHDDGDDETHNDAFLRQTHHSEHGDASFSNQDLDQEIDEIISSASKTPSPQNDEDDGVSNQWNDSDPDDNQPTVSDSTLIPLPSHYSILSTGVQSMSLSGEAYLLHHRSAILSALRFLLHVVQTIPQSNTVLHSTSLRKDDGLYQSLSRRGKSPSLIPPGTFLGYHMDMGIDLGGVSGAAVASGETSQGQPPATAEVYNVIARQGDNNTTNESMIVNSNVYMATNGHEGGSSDENQVGGYQVYSKLLSTTFSPLYAQYAPASLGICIVMLLVEILQTQSAYLYSDILQVIPRTRMKLLPTLASSVGDRREAFALMNQLQSISATCLKSIVQFYSTHDDIPTVPVLSPAPMNLSTPPSSPPASPGAIQAVLNELPEVMHSILQPITSPGAPKRRAEFSLSIPRLKNFTDYQVTKSSLLAYLPRLTIDAAHSTSSHHQLAMHEAEGEDLISLAFSNYIEHVVNTKHAHIAQQQIAAAEYQRALYEMTGGEYGQHEHSQLDNDQNHLHHHTTVATQPNDQQLPTAIEHYDIVSTMEVHLIPLFDLIMPSILNLLRYSTLIYKHYSLLEADSAHPSSDSPDITHITGQQNGNIIGEQLSRLYSTVHHLLLVNISDTSSLFLKPMNIHAIHRHCPDYIPRSIMSYHISSESIVHFLSTSDYFSLTTATPIANRSLSHRGGANTHQNQGVASPIVDPKTLISSIPSSASTATPGGQSVLAKPLGQATPHRPSTRATMASHQKVTEQPSRNVAIPHEIFLPSGLRSSICEGVFVWDSLLSTTMSLTGLAVSTTIRLGHPSADTPDIAANKHELHRSIVYQTHLDNVSISLGLLVALLPVARNSLPMIAPLLVMITTGVIQHLSYMMMQQMYSKHRLLFQSDALLHPVVYDKRISVAGDAQQPASEHVFSYYGDFLPHSFPVFSHDALPILQAAFKLAHVHTLVSSPTASMTNQTMDVAQSSSALQAGTHTSLPQLNAISQLLVLANYYVDVIHAVFAHTILISTSVPVPSLSATRPVLTSVYADGGVPVGTALGGTSTGLSAGLTQSALSSGNPAGTSTTDASGSGGGGLAGLSTPKTSSRLPPSLQGLSESTNTDAHSCSNHTKAGSPFTQSPSMVPLSQAYSMLWNTRAMLTTLGMHTRGKDLLNDTTINYYNGNAMSTSVYLQLENVTNIIKSQISLVSNDNTYDFHKWILPQQRYLASHEKLEYNDENNITLSPKSLAAVFACFYEPSTLTLCGINLADVRQFYDSILPSSIPLPQHQTISPTGLHRDKNGYDTPGSLSNSMPTPSKRNKTPPASHKESTTSDQPSSRSADDSFSLSSNQRITQTNQTLFMKRGHVAHGPGVIRSRTLLGRGSMAPERHEQSIKATPGGASANQNGGAGGGTGLFGWIFGSAPKQSQVDYLEQSKGNSAAELTRFYVLQLFDNVLAALTGLCLLPSIEDAKLRHIQSQSSPSHGGDGENSYLVNNNIAFPTLSNLPHQSKLPQSHSIGNHHDSNRRRFPLGGSSTLQLDHLSFLDPLAHHQQCIDKYSQLLNTTRFQICSLTNNMASSYPRRFVNTLLSIWAVSLRAPELSLVKTHPVVQIPSPSPGQLESTQFVIPSSSHTSHVAGPTSNNTSTFPYLLEGNATAKHDYGLHLTPVHYILIDILMKSMHGASFFTCLLQQGEFILDLVALYHRQQTASINKKKAPTPNYTPSPNMMLHMDDSGVLVEQSRRFHNIRRKLALTTESFRGKKDTSENGQQSITSPPDQIDTGVVYDDDQFNTYHIDGTYYAQAYRSIHIRPLTVHETVSTTVTLDEPTARGMRHHYHQQQAQHVSALALPSLTGSGSHSSGSSSSSNVNHTIIPAVSLSLHEITFFHCLNAFTSLYQHPTCHEYYYYVPFSYQGQLPNNRGGAQHSYLHHSLQNQNTTYSNRACTGPILAALEHFSVDHHISKSYILDNYSARLFPAVTDRFVCYDSIMSPVKSLHAIANPFVGGSHVVVAPTLIQPSTYSYEPLLPPTTQHQPVIAALASTRNLGVNRPGPAAPAPTGSGHPTVADDASDNPSWAGPLATVGVTPASTNALGANELYHGQQTTPLQALISSTFATPQGLRLLLALLPSFTSLFRSVMRLSDQMATGGFSLLWSSLISTRLTTKLNKRTIQYKMFLADLDAIIYHYQRASIVQAWIATPWTIAEQIGGSSQHAASHHRDPHVPYQPFPSPSHAHISGYDHISPHEHQLDLLPHIFDCQPSLNESGLQSSLISVNTVNGTPMKIQTNNSTVLLTGNQDGINIHTTNVHLLDIRAFFLTAQSLLISMTESVTSNDAVYSLFFSLPLTPVSMPDQYAGTSTVRGDKTMTVPYSFNRVPFGESPRVLLTPVEFLSKNVDAPLTNLLPSQPQRQPTPHQDGCVFYTGQALVCETPPQIPFPSYHPETTSSLVFNNNTSTTAYLHWCTSQHDQQVHYLNQTPHLSINCIHRTYSSTCDDRNSTLETQYSIGDIIKHCERISQDTSVSPKLSHQRITENGKILAGDNHSAYSQYYDHQLHQTLDLLTGSTHHLPHTSSSHSQPLTLPNQSQTRFYYHYKGGIPFISPSWYRTVHLNSAQDEAAAITPTMANGSGKMITGHNQTMVYRSTVAHSPLQRQSLHALRLLCILCPTLVDSLYLLSSPQHTVDLIAAIRFDAIITMLMKRHKLHSFESFHYLQHQHQQRHVQHDYGSNSNPTVNANQQIVNQIITALSSVTALRTSSTDNNPSQLSTTVSSSSQTSSVYETQQQQQYNVIEQLQQKSITSILQPIFSLLLPMMGQSRPIYVHHIQAISSLTAILSTNRFIYSERAVYKPQCLQHFFQSTVFFQAHRSTLSNWCTILPRMFDRDKEAIMKRLAMQFNEGYYNSALYDGDSAPHGAHPSSGGVAPTPAGPGSATRMDLSTISGSIDRKLLSDLFEKCHLKQGWKWTRDADLIQRGINIKKLAFLLLSSRFDQYTRYITDITEIIVNSLRLIRCVHSEAQRSQLLSSSSSSLYSMLSIAHLSTMRGALLCFPAIVFLHTNVLLLFRVLLTKMGTDHLHTLFSVIFIDVIDIFSSIYAKTIDITSSSAINTTGKSSVTSNLATSALHSHPEINLHNKIRTKFDGFYDNRSIFDYSSAGATINDNHIVPFQTLCVSQLLIPTPHILQHHRTPGSPGSNQHPPVNTAAISADNAPLFQFNKPFLQLLLEAAKVIDFSLLVAPHVFFTYRSYFMNLDLFAIEMMFLNNPSYPHIITQHPPSSSSSSLSTPPVESAVYDTIYNRYPNLPLSLALSLQQRELSHVKSGRFQESESMAVITSQDYTKDYKNTSTSFHPHLQVICNSGPTALAPQASWLFSTFSGRSNRIQVPHNVKTLKRIAGRDIYNRPLDAGHDSHGSDGDHNYAINMPFLYSSQTRWSRPIIHQHKIYQVSDLAVFFCVLSNVINNDMAHMTHYHSGGSESAQTSASAKGIRSSPPPLNTTTNANSSLLEPIPPATTPSPHCFDIDQGHLNTLVHDLFHKPSLDPYTVQKIDAICSLGQFGQIPEKQSSASQLTKLDHVALYDAAYAKWLLLNDFVEDPNHLE